MIHVDQKVESFLAESPNDGSYQSSSEQLPETFRMILREMVYEIVNYRDLLMQLTLRDIRIRYKQAILGFGWAIFMPMLIVGAGFLIKYAIAEMAGTDLKLQSVRGMAVKALPWAFFVGAINFATTSLTSNMNLVTKIYFPREVFPLSAVLAQACDTAIGSIALAVVLVFLGLGLSMQLLWGVPLVLLLLLMTAGAGLFLSCANLFFRDVKYIVQVLLTFGIFFTPVFYEPENFGPQGCQLMMLNPLSPLLEGFRLAIVEQHNLLSPLLLTSSAGQEIIAWHPWYLAYAGLWAILGFFGSWLMFHKFEFVYAEYV